MTDQNGATGGQGTEASGPREERATGTSSGPRARWPFVLAGAVVITFIIGVLVILYAPNPDVWTDDATVMVHYATIAPRIGGQIDAVTIADNQLVRAGQVLARIDPRDREAQVTIVQRQLQQDRARFADTGANLDRQPPVIEQQRAAVAAAQARLAFARDDEKRFANLAAANAGTLQQRQQAVAQVRQDEADLQGARAAVDIQLRQLAQLGRAQTVAAAAVRTDEARLAQAKLELGYTTITAPVDGVIGDRSVQVGDHVEPGTALMAIVPLASAYIEANYLETALRHVRPGQHVRIHVDAYDIDLDGIVQSIPPATGAEFAPIAPSNATGNFTKIVQRLPIEIDLVAAQPLARLLRAGFSVETTIHTGLADIVKAQRSTSALVLGN